MLFLDPWFWGFAALAIPLFWLCPGPLKVWWLAMASAVFQYHFAGLAGMLPVWALALLTYGVGRIAPGERGHGMSVAAGAVMLGALAVYKYSGLAVRTIGGGLRVLDLGAPSWLEGWLAPVAPLGISFFTFEFIHYLYEVRVRRREPVRDPLHFAVFALFFPTLAAGPIKRFPDFVPQLDGLRNPPLATLWPAAQRIIRGLFKKVCVADLLVECIKVFEDVPHHNPLTLALLAMMQGWRIYYDFAGYTDIAIGMGQLLGLRLPENFDRPYGSTSLQEFWRRWHMSLSSWIRDYIYIPLGGNQRHRLLNLGVAMFLCGLWHGAAWHFAAWGVYHGGGLALEAGVRRRRPDLFTASRGRRLAGWVVCYTFVTFGWLLFFYPLGTVYTFTKDALLWRCTF